jgi:hypothetical protein
MWNVGDPVEFDAGAGSSVSAISVSGPPKRMTREEIDAGASPYRSLAPGDVTVRGGALGTIAAVGRAGLMVRVAPYEVTIREGALRAAERRHLERDEVAGYIFAFDKNNLVPLKLENERRWGARRNR